MAATLMEEYNSHSFSAALGDGANNTDPPSPLASDGPEASPWERMFRGLTSQRQQELLTSAVLAVGESKFRGLRKEPLLAELRRGLAGELPTSESAKFFVMQAAVGGDRFAFRCGNWRYPKQGPGSSVERLTATLRADGGIAMEGAPASGCVAIENPWNPLRGRGAYKKPELVGMVQDLFGEAPQGAKADALYAMLAGQLRPLEQP